MEELGFELCSQEVVLEEDIQKVGSITIQSRKVGKCGMSRGW